MDNVKYINFKGETDYSVSGHEKLYLVSPTPFNVKRRIGDEWFFEAANIMEWHGDFQEKEHFLFQIPKDAEATLKVEFLPLRYESNNGEQLAIDVDTSEMSMYDRLRNDLLVKISEYADSKGLDTLYDDDDMEFEEDNSDVPLTPYEYKEMQEEYLSDEKVNDVSQESVVESNANDSSEPDPAPHSAVKGNDSEATSE